MASDETIRAALSDDALAQAVAVAMGSAGHEFLCANPKGTFDEWIHARCVAAVRTVRQALANAAEGEG